MSEPVADPDIADAVRRLVGRRLRVDDSSALPDDIALVDLGLDSAGLLDIVLGIEERFAIDIADEDITAENIGTLGRLVSFVRDRFGRA